ncbi:hypothetical protein S245_056147 [Arachis hypogaea]
MEIEKSNDNNEFFRDEQQESGCNRKQKRKGGLRTLPFIFSNEFCDRFAVAGFNGNLISYLTQVMNMPLVSASNILTIIGGTSSFTPLLGALIAESFAGQYWTITAASLIYQLVRFLIINYFSFWIDFHHSVCYTSTYTASTMSKTSELPRSHILTTMDTIHKWNIFNWYFFGLGLASLTALTIVVYIQDNTGWGWGFGIPTIVMLFSILAFVLGSPLYRNVKPKGSPLVRLVQVIVAAIRKRKEDLPNDPNLFYQNKELDAPISLEGRLQHTDQYKWLDRATIVTEEEARDLNSAPNLWKLATVHRVEELKSIIKIIPISSTGILLITASSHLPSFVIQQARTMNRHLSHSFQISPANMSVFSVITMMAGVALYDVLFVPLVRRFTKNPTGITCIQRMGIGFMINIVATAISAPVEVKRKEIASQHNLLDDPTAIIPISVFWLVPQYCLHGLADVFMSVGLFEFLYDQSPESMRSSATAIYCIVIAIGSYVGTFLVTLVHKYSGKNEKNWLPDRNLNRGRLEYYYLLVSGVQVLNLIYFVICVRFYTYKPVEENISEINNKGEDLEQNGEKLLLEKPKGDKDDQNKSLSQK